jgi:hypothetical protein
LLDIDTKKPIVEGKKITGFTTQAEYDMGIMDGLRAWNEPMIDEHARALGANCMAAILPHCLPPIHMLTFTVQTSGLKESGMTTTLSMAGWSPG